MSLNVYLFEEKNKYAFVIQMYKLFALCYNNLAEVFEE